MTFQCLPLCIEELLQSPFSILNILRNLISSASTSACKKILSNDDYLASRIIRTQHGCWQNSGFELHAQSKHFCKFIELSYELVIKLKSSTVFPRASLPFQSSQLARGIVLVRFSYFQIFLIDCICSSSWQEKSFAIWRLTAHAEWAAIKSR